MKNVFKFILFCFSIATLVTLACMRVNAQVPTSPTYTGVLDDKVFIPAVFKGKNYKITGDRVGGSVTNNYGDTLSDKDATITHSGTGLLTQMVGKNGYGLFIFTNDTGAPLAAAHFVSVAFSDVSDNLPIPVITDYTISDDITVNHIAAIHINTYGFDFILKAQMPVGESITITYNVKGF